MNAFVIAALFVNSPSAAEAEYNVSVCILRGDPLGTIAEKTVKLINSKCLSLPDNSVDSIPRTGVFYLTDVKDLRSYMGIALNSVNGTEAKLECSSVLNASKKEAVLPFCKLQIKLGELKTIRLHNFSTEDQMWAIVVVVTKKEPGKDAILSPVNHLVEPAASKP